MVGLMKSVFNPGMNRSLYELIPPVWLCTMAAIEDSIPVLQSIWHTDDAEY